MTKPDELLNTRHETHGDWALTAVVAQEIKNTMRGAQQKRLTSEQREALDLIATKMARIASGDPTVKDHWVDIAGYAMLGARTCAD